MVTALVLLIAAAMPPAPAQAQPAQQAQAQRASAVVSDLVVGSSVLDSGDDPAGIGGFGALDDDGLDWDGPARDQFQDELPSTSSTFVSGTAAGIRSDGKATIPRTAPERVRSLLSHLNRIVGKRYKWGGGHAKLADKGYDCSGAVSYGLIGAGLLAYSMVSGDFARWGKDGGGRWVTIYANKRHVYMEVAGLRLDTSTIGDLAIRKGVRWRPIIGKRTGFKVRHVAGL